MNKTYRLTLTRVGRGLRGWGSVFCFGYLKASNFRATNARKVESEDEAEIRCLSPRF